MSQLEKIEIMDFLINVLKEHEKILDELVSQTKLLLETNEFWFGKEVRSFYDSSRTVKLKDWGQLSKITKMAEFVCYNLADNSFTVQANIGSKIFEYKETVPDLFVEIQEDGLKICGFDANKHNDLAFFDGKLENGLKLKTTINSRKHNQSISFELDKDCTQKWLSTQLGISEEFIFYGEIQT